MDTHEHTVSLASRHALQDMVEFEMYLLAQSQQAAWPMFPRGRKPIHKDRTPYSSVVERVTVNELLIQKFIEATSSQTFVVSKLGHCFYEREMSPV
jgi:hypothetical protein